MKQFHFHLSEQFKLVGADVTYAIQLNSKICPIGSDRTLYLLRMKSRGLGTSYQACQKVIFCCQSRHFSALKYCENDLQQLGKD